MLSKQAEVFGFPNSLIGIAAFAIFVALAVALFAEIQFPAWFWNLALLGTLLGVIFSHWLAQQTTFVIGALCPYCMIAWFGNFLILSSVIQEVLRIRAGKASEDSERLAIEKITGFMPIFHLVWLGLVIGAAFVGVS